MSEQMLALLKKTYAQYAEQLHLVCDSYVVDQAIEWLILKGEREQWRNELKNGLMMVLW